MTNFINGFYKVLGFAVVIVILAVIGTFVFKSCTNNDTKTSGPAFPREAVYKLTEKATGNYILTKKPPKVEGVKVGERIYTVYGYWQITKDKFRYFDITLPLNEKYIGEIRLEPVKK